ncbi:hypothetical protein L1280_001686 [Deinococcus sp. HSC-46F16]|uniref:hypothetical protein n=1 Tax=Deinococcus sp. HSC-46F16 TaxID=2910968 RepID=UPI00209EC837|nr:hypothetical protein [Deinococcus sp. HSC-46F16]MCP2014535.1 hypothetical protein [Deinococcus sp. HSC-46F16]
MNHWARGFLWTLVPAATAVATLMSATVTEPVVPRLGLKSRPCQPSPQFRPSGQQDSGGLVREGEGYRMTGLSWLQADLCGPGTLVITADGEAGAGEQPRLDIALNGKVIASESFGKRRTAEVSVPDAGVLTLTFVNDLFLADVRLATFAQPYLLGSKCNQITDVVVPPESAAGWDKFSRSGTVLRRSPPVTLVPCGAGQLSIALKGQAAGGEYPLVVFRQNGEVIQNARTGEGFERIKFAVTAHPIEIAVGNPYAVLRFDRNLNIRQLKLRPIPIED